MPRSRITLKDYFIEFIIVLLGITIAFWLSNLGEKRKEKELEAQYIQDIEQDLADDIKALNFSIEQGQKKLERLVSVVNYYQGGETSITADSLPDYANLIGNYSFFIPNDYTYISLQQSGDFSLLRDRDLKRNLIQIYELFETIKFEQNNVISALDQNYFPVLMKNFDMLSGSIVNAEYFQSTQFRNSVVFMINETSTLIWMYKSAQKRIEALIENL